MGDRDQRFQVPRPGDNVQVGKAVKGLKKNEPYEVVYTGRTFVIVANDGGVYAVDHDDLMFPNPVPAHPVGVGPRLHDVEGRDPDVQPELVGAPTDRDKGE